MFTNECLSQTHSVIWMKDVGRRRVVDDDHLLQVPPQLVEVLDVVAAVEDARLSEQTCPEHTPSVEQVSNRVRILNTTKYLFTIRVLSGIFQRLLSENFLGYFKDKSTSTKYFD